MIVLSSNFTCRKLFWTVFTLKEFLKFQRYLSKFSWIFSRSGDASDLTSNRTHGSTTHEAHTKGSVVVCLIFGIFKIWGYTRCSKAGFSKLWPTGQIQLPPVFLNRVSLEQRCTYTSGIMFGYIQTRMAKLSSCYRDLGPTISKIFTVWPFKKKFVDPWSKVSFNHEASWFYNLRKSESEMS